MHMDWMRAVCGRIKSDIRYSKDVVYNNFVFPELDEARRRRLDELADEVLTARLENPSSKLAHLYDDALMPVALRRAHREIDAYVDNLYRDEPFNSEAERVGYLLQLHGECDGAASGARGIRTPRISSSSREGSSQVSGGRAEERLEYFCPCGKGKVIEEHDNTPGHQEHGVRILCGECQVRWRVMKGRPVRGWRLERVRARP